MNNKLEILGQSLSKQIELNRVVKNKDEIFLAGTDITNQGGLLWLSIPTHQVNSHTSSLSSTSLPIILRGDQVCSQFTSSPFSNKISFIIEKVSQVDGLINIRYGEAVYLKEKNTGLYLQFNDHLPFIGRLRSSENLVCSPWRIPALTSDNSKEETTEMSSLMMNQNWQCCGGYNFILNDLKKTTQGNPSLINTFQFVLGPGGNPFDDGNGWNKLPLDPVNFNDTLILSPVGGFLHSTNSLCSWNQQDICNTELCVRNYGCGNYFAFPLSIETKEYGKMMVPYAGTIQNANLTILSPSDPLVVNPSLTKKQKDKPPLSQINKDTLVKKTGCSECKDKQVIYSKSASILLISLIGIAVIFFFLFLNKKPKK